MIVLLHEDGDTENHTEKIGHGLRDLPTAGRQFSVVRSLAQGWMEIFRHWVRGGRRFTPPPVPHRKTFMYPCRCPELLDSLRIQFTVDKTACC